MLPLRYFFYHKILKKHCYLADAPFGFLVCILQPRVLMDTELLVVHAGAWLQSQRLPSVLTLVILNGTVKEYHCVTVDCKTVFVCVRERLCVCVEISLQMDNKAICFWIL